MAVLKLQNKQEVLFAHIDKEYRRKSMDYLVKTFSMELSDCEDIIQESSIILYHAACNGTLDHLKSSLFTFFIGICKNKAFEKLRSNRKMPIDYYGIDAEGSDSRIMNNIENRASLLLKMIDEDEEVIRAKQTIVRELVKKLPSPCNELLWSYYRDGLSMKDIANIYGYSSESVAKVTKHRCQEKFRVKYEELTSIKRRKECNVEV